MRNGIYEEAERLCGEGRLGEALSLYRSAMLRSPEDVEAHLGAGRTFLQLGRCLEAIEIFERAALLDEGNGAIFHQLGDANFELGRWPEAVRAYQRAVALRPEFAWSHCNLGRALARLGRAEEATACLNKAIEIEPAFYAIVEDLAAESSRGASPSTVPMQHRGVGGRREAEPMKANAVAAIAVNKSVISGREVAVDGMFWDGRKAGIFFGWIADQGRGNAKLLKAVRDQNGRELGDVAAMRYERPDLQGREGSRLGIVARFSTADGAPPSGLELEFPEYVVRLSPLPPLLRPDAAYPALRAAYLACDRSAVATWREQEWLDQIFEPFFDQINRQLDTQVHIEERLELGRAPVNPLVSIIIPLHRTMQFVHHQFNDFLNDPFVARQEILFVLDPPERMDESFTPARALCTAFSELESLYPLPARLLVLNQNGGFCRACNLAAEEARAPYLLLLNSDVLPVEPGWLELMLSCMTAHPDVGVVGAKLLFPNGSLQHAGLSWQRSPAARNLFTNVHPMKGYDPELVGVRGVQPCHAVTGACMLLRAADFDSVGMLSTEYLFGDFADADLCLKICATGKRVVCENRVALFHCEGTSFAPWVRSEGYGLNIRRFNRLWGPAVESLLS